MDSVGNETWSKTYNTSSYELGSAVIQTSEGGYIIAGDHDDSGAACLIKTNSIGDTLWTKDFNPEGDRAFHSLHQTLDHGYIVWGEAGVAGRYGDLYLVKTDSNGNTSGCGELHNIVIPKSVSCSPNNCSIQETSVIGTVSPTNTIVGSGINPVDPCQIVTGLNPEKQIRNPAALVYPNPSSGLFNIESQLLGNSIEFEVYNIYGSKIYFHSIPNPSLFQVDLSAYPSGVYFFRFESQTNLLVRKVIIQ